MKNDASIFSLRNIKILTNMQKNFFEILVQAALTVGLFWTILKSTPKSPLLSFTLLHFSWYQKNSSFRHFNPCSVLKTKKPTNVCYDYWEFLIHFWRSFWWPVFDAVQNSSLKKLSKSLVKCQHFSKTTLQ